MEGNSVNSDRERERERERRNKEVLFLRFSEPTISHFYSHLQRLAKCAKGYL